MIDLSNWRELTAAILAAIAGGTFSWSTVWPCIKRHLEKRAPEIVPELRSEIEFRKLRSAWRTLAEYFHAQGETAEGTIGQAMHVLGQIIAEKQFRWGPPGEDQTP